MSNLIGAVWLSRPDTLEPIMFGPDDDEIPDWALERMGDHCFVDGKRPKTKGKKGTGSTGSDTSPDGDADPAPPDAGGSASPYDGKSATELRAEIDKRNDGREAAWKISKAGGKEAMTAALQLDDDLAAGEYDHVNVDDLKAEMERRNTGRDEDAQVHVEAPGNKAELVAALTADDETEE